jgi:uncharacterized protein YbjT (DUF2867 family)
MTSKELTMKIAITTPTGHIGGKVAWRVLSSDYKAVLLCRDLSKVQKLADSGAEVRLGSQDDAKFLTEALRGVDALLWVTPPNNTSADVRGFQIACGKAAAQAIHANRIARVVNIASVGAHLGKGTGLVNGLHDVELLLNDCCENVAHLRPGFFFENFLMQWNSIRDQSCFYSTVSGSRRLPMIATGDIAVAAGELLLDGSWKGRQIRGLHGPTDLSFNEAAERLSRGLERAIRYVQIDEPMMRRSLRGLGCSDDFIDLMIEMYRGADSGWMKAAETRTVATTTPTPLEHFAREEMAPMLRKAVAA